ncbi:hypothetical protein [Paraflavitalea soli]|nr:hypothetical protein [Paraflavitalea soli]
MRKILPFTLFILLLTSCTRYAIYQSPLHINTNQYRPTPMHQEGTPAATYAGFHFAAGGANHRWHDPTYSFAGTLHRSHNFGNFQASYGTNLILGNYSVRGFNIMDSIPFSDRAAFDIAGINSRAGNKFFGAWGFTGSINVRTDVGKGEWRVLGTELTWNNEFGEYQSYRRKLPPGMATMVDRHRNYFTYGFFTEILGPVGAGQTLGYKVAWIAAAHQVHDERGIGQDFGRENYHPGYLSQTLHFTFGTTTLYGAFSLGSYAFDCKVGASLRLSNMKKAGNHASL